MDQQELRARLLHTFLDELSEHALGLQAGALALRGQLSEREQRENLQAVFRIFHTIKGAARAAGVPLLERLAHRVEDQLGVIRDSKEPVAAVWVDRLLLAVDALTESGLRLKRQQQLPGPDLTALFATLGEAVEPAEVEATVEPATHVPGATVRTSTQKLDTLLQASARASLAAEREDVGAHVSGLRAAAKSLGGPQAAVRAFDQRLTALERMVEGSQREVRQTVQEVSDAALSVRLAPFDEACQGLGRAVHDIATATGKSAGLVSRDGAVELDRRVLETVREALLHLVRNAVDHGLELPDERERKGKPREGTVTISAELSGDLVRIGVSDDGRGIDWSKVRAAARRLGLAEPKDQAELSELLFAPGLSGAEQITEVSGRGVGLDVVRNKVRELRGTVELVETKEGTRFLLVVPVTLARLRVVLLGQGDQVFCVPAYGIARVLRIARASLGRVAGKDVIGAQGNLPVIALWSVLGLPGPASPSERLNVVVLQRGELQQGLEVERVEEERDVTVHPFGGRFSDARQLLGAAFLSGGRIAPILDPLALIQRAQSVTAAAPATGPVAKRARRVLLADDSPTTRTLERMILESHGYEVVVVMDGAEAWELLQHQVVDVVVSDVEMPVMTGLELTRAIRSSQRLASLPVVLVTGLANEPDRRRGLDAGANGYLVKSAFDQKDLLDIIQQLL